MIEVMFTSNDGGGYAHKKQVKEGTTLAQFFRNEKPTADPSNFNIRVNRQEQPQNYRLRQGDRITATPKKVHGA